MAKQRITFRLMLWVLLWVIGAPLAALGWLLSFLLYDNLIRALSVITSLQDKIVHGHCPFCGEKKL